MPHEDPGPGPAAPAAPWTGCQAEAHALQREQPGLGRARGRGGWRPVTTEERGWRRRALMRR